MQEADSFNLIVKSATGAGGRSPAELRAIRDAIWPEGMPVFAKVRYPAVLSVHSRSDEAFFDRPLWSMADAIWMLSTGEAPTKHPSEQRIGFDRALSGVDEDWSGRKPHKRAFLRAQERLLESYAPWLAAHSVFSDPDAADELFGAALVLPSPRHFHEWIRWATVFGLPIHRRFWDGYYSWKASRWTSGSLVAWTCALRGGDWRPVRYGPIPSELTWRIPYSEDLGLMMEADAPVRFINNWQCSPEQVLEVAANPGAQHFWKRRNVRMSPAARTRIAGAVVEERVGRAVSALAREFKLSPERDGRYFFGEEQAVLMLWLVTLDPSLADYSVRSISVVLPGFVRGKPSSGRPPRS